MTAAWIDRWCATCDSGALAAISRAELVHDLLELVLRDDAVDQTDARRLRGVDAATGEQDLGRLAGTDERDERRGGLVRVADAELGRGDPELRVVGADAHVGRERDHHPTADAVAVDQRDHRLADREHAAAGRVGAASVAAAEC